MLVLILFYISVITAQDINLIKEEQKDFKKITSINSDDSLSTYYNSIYLPSKLTDFVYAMRMYEISERKIVVDQMFEAMPQDKLEYVNFYSLTENLFSDTVLNRKLNNYVYNYPEILSKLIILRKHYMPNYLKFNCTLEGEMVESSAYWFVNTLKLNPKLFYNILIKENSRIKERILDILHYGNLDYNVKLPGKYKNFFQLDK